MSSKPSKPPGFSSLVAFRDVLASMCGGACVVLVLFAMRDCLVPQASLSMLVASMGASAVLVFGVPHGVFSRPSNLLAGHLVSALLGVACAKNIPSEILAAALSVGLSIGAMRLLRCVHPPGGATALTAVIGGDFVHELGYGFVWNPVLLSAAVLACAGALYRRMVSNQSEEKNSPEKNSALDIPRGRDFFDGGTAVREDKSARQ